MFCALANFCNNKTPSVSFAQRALLARLQNLQRGFILANVIFIRPI